MIAHRRESGLRRLLRRIFAFREFDRVVAIHRQQENDLARREGRDLPYPDEQDWRRS